MMKKPEVRSHLMFQQGTGKGPKMSKEEAQKKIREMRERDEEMVTGIFENKENPARDGNRGAVCFGFKKYPGQPYTFYELWDGERYTLPRMVAMHLNNGCFYKEYQHLPGEFGEAGMRQASNPEGRMLTHNKQMARKVYRYGFKTLEFVDDDMYPSHLVEVTNTL